MENTNTNVNVDNTTSTTGTENQEGVKTYTQEEVLALLQSEADKRVTAALKKQQAKFEKQLSLSKLDVNDREKAEKDDRIAELEEQLAQFQLEHHKTQLKNLLMSRGLSPEFVDLVSITEESGLMHMDVDGLEKLFKASVKSEVEKRLAGNAPKGNGNGAAGLSKESVKNMSMAQLNELAQKNPELFNQLFN
jgi:hypothetical protein